MSEVSTPAQWEPQVLLQLSGSNGKGYPCTLRGLFKGTLHVFSAQPIARTTNLTVSFGDAMIAGTVSYCRSKDKRYLVSISVNSPGEARRRDPRLPLNRTCSVTALGGKHSEKLAAIITDISASGMGIQLPQRLDIGTMICVHADDFLAAGQVLYCRYLTEDQFAAGLELTDLLWKEQPSAPALSAKGKNWFRRIWWD